MCQATQNTAFAFEPFLAVLSHQRDIENLHCDAPLKSSVASFRQPNGAHSPMTNLRNQGVDAKGLTCQPRPFQQFQSTRFEKTFLRKHALLTKQDFQLICQSWVLALKGGQPGRALFACHLQRVVEVGTKGLPLIRAELGHLFLRLANPLEYSDADRYAPFPTFSVRYVQTSSPGQRFRRTKTRRKTSCRLVQPA